MESTDKAIATFKKIDFYLFSQIDLFKSGPIYAKILELLNSLTREHRLILNQLVTLILITFPFFIVLTLFWSNHQQKKSLEVKKEILQVAKDITSYEREIQNVKRNILSTPALKNSQEIDSKVRNALSRSSIDTKNVLTQNFQLDNSVPHIFKATVDLNFSHLTTTQFIEMVSNLMRYEKVKVLGVSIIKDKSDDLLKGKLQVAHFSEEQP